jgi:hypothetical protein
MRRRCRDDHTDDDTDGRQDGGDRHDRFDLLPLRTEAALGENHHKRRISEHLGQLDVVEGEAERTVLSYGDADSEVDEEGGKSAAGRQANGYDGDEQYGGTDQQDLVEVVDSQGTGPFNFVA